MSRHFLIFNAGSSSLKFAVFNASGLQEETRAQIGGFTTRPILECGSRTIPYPCDDFNDGVPFVLEWLEGEGFPVRNLCGVGHRIVHGGERFVSPCIVKDEDINALDGMRKLAPLHQPFGLDLLRAAKSRLRDLPHVACLDTAFHATQPDIATRLPLPQIYREKGYRRYGFHGLNYAHIVEDLPKITGRPLPRRMLAAHLGSGAGRVGCNRILGRHRGTCPFDQKRNSQAPLVAAPTGKMRPCRSGR